MKKLIAVVMISSCLSGIIGFVIGNGISYIDDRAQLQALFEIHESVSDIHTTDLGRSHPSYWATFYLAAADSDDPEDLEAFKYAITPQIIEYASELRTRITLAEDTENLALYKSTLERIEEITGIETQDAENQ